MPNYFASFLSLFQRYGYSHVLGSSSSSRLVSLTNSLSCGILLGTCFLGMWPAAESKWEEAKAAGPPSASGASDRGWSRHAGNEEGGPESVRSRVPWHNAMVLMGFCAVFSLQQILSAVGKSGNCAVCASEFGTHNLYCRIVKKPLKNYAEYSQQCHGN